MAVLHSCLCCSLLMGSIIGGVYTTVVYLVAFVIALWWILESEAGPTGEVDQKSVSVPIPAYLLCVGYLIITVMSIWMLYGLYKKNERHLLAWVFVMTLFCFPEMGMVVFMSLVHWKITSSYGLADLIFYIFRAAFNLMTVLCVQSQYATWRDAVVNCQTLKAIEHLRLNNMNKETNDGGGETVVSYNNPAFVSFPEPPVTHTTSPAILTRSYSMASQHSSYRDRPPVMGALAPLKMGVPGWDPYMSVARDSQSEFNAATFTPGSVGFMPLVAPSRSEATLFPPQVGINVYHHNTQLFYRTDVPVNGAVLHPNFTTQSLDRRRYFRHGRGDSSSMDALNLRAHSLTHGSPGYLRAAHESRSSLGADSDDFRKYRDIAL